MSAKEMTGTVTEISVTAQDFYVIRFRADEPLHFEPGQFLSLRVPIFPKINEPHHPRYDWRLFSFASAPDNAFLDGIELYIRPAEGGITGPYLAALKPGAKITYRASFGEFKFHEGTGRAVVFISTGTGLAPIRSIALSKVFQAERRPFSLAIIGFQYQVQIPFDQEFEKLGIETRYALSRSIGKIPAPLFAGRVTDFIKKMSEQFPWRECDYYICGNTHMIHDVRELLAGKQVPHQQILYEAFESDAVRVLKKKAA